MSENFLGALRQLRAYLYAWSQMYREAGMGMLKEVPFRRDCAFLTARLFNRIITDANYIHSITSAVDLS
jgi:hypothetical protein